MALRLPLPLLHGEGGLQVGWHDWPWFAGFAVGVALLWWAARRLGRKPRRPGS